MSSKPTFSCFGYLAFGLEGMQIRILFTVMNPSSAHGQRALLQLDSNLFVIFQDLVVMHLLEH